jgi:hypothetical protein
VGIFAEGRSKKYDSNGDGTPDRPCSEHTVRYGQGGNASTACNVPYTSDFNLSRPGAYSPTGKPNQTPGMNWLPEVPMLVNNVIANQGGPMPSGWTPCGGYTPVCVYGYVSSPTIDVALNTVFPKSAVINGNIYQTTGSQVMWLQSRGSSAATGTFRAANLAAIKGSTGFGSSYFGLAVEANGRSGLGYVNADGTRTALLTSLDGQAAPVPVDAKVNKYVPAGSRSYGYRG